MFTFPAALWGLVLLPVYAWLRAGGLRPAVLRVSSLLLWERVAEETALGRAARRRVTLAVLLELVALLLATLGAAGPKVELSRRSHPRAVVLDRSLAMATRTAGGRTRWQEAIDRLARWLARADPTDPVGLFLPGPEGRVEVHETTSSAAPEVLRRLKPVHLALDLGPALVRARAFAAGQANAPLLVLTGREPAGWAPAASNETLSCVGGPSRNLAIVSFAVAPAGPGRVRVAARVKSFAAAPAEGTWRVDAGGDPALAAVPLRLGPGASAFLVVEVAQGAAEMLRTRLEPPDELEEDDSATARLDALGGARVALVGRAEPDLERALTVAAGGMPPARVATAAEATPDRFDLAVCAGVLPAAQPDLPVVLVAPPAGSVGPAVVGGPREVAGLSRVAAEDALLADVDLRRLALRRVSPVRVAAGAPPPHVLAEADGAPFLCRWDATAHPLLVIGVDLAWSGDTGATDWALLPEFALFWDNVVAQLARPRPAAWGRVGQPVPLAGGGGPPAGVVGPGGNVPVDGAGGAASFLPLYQGIYEVRAGGRVRRLPVNVLDAAASDNRGRRDAPPAAPAAAATSGAAAHAPWPLAPWLLGAAALAVVASLLLGRPRP